MISIDELCDEKISEAVLLYVFKIALSASLLWQRAGWLGIIPNHSYPGNSLTTSWETSAKPAPREFIQYPQKNYNLLQSLLFTNLESWTILVSIRYRVWYLNILTFLRVHFYMTKWILKNKQYFSTWEEKKMI